MEMISSMTVATARSESAGPAASAQVWCVASAPTDWLPARLELARGKGAVTRVLPAQALAAALGELADPGRLAAIFLLCEDDDSFRALARSVRREARFWRTRIYLIAGEGHGPIDFGPEDELDIEYVLPRASLDRAGWTAAITAAIGAFEALHDHPTTHYYFLDNRFNEVFSWFERTRWDISELPDLSGVSSSSLRPEHVRLIKHAAIAEFGTLPGAHNFLREWEDEVSFSSWALSWGAEESRHSLLLCRYLRAIGVEVMSKHALYKRAPYPSGPSQASTLMMNVISEMRAAEIYRHCAQEIDEPIAKQLFMLFSRDEARHASAFAQFCKELCDAQEHNKVSALEQAYFWLAQQKNGGFKHPAGEFFPHTATSEGFAHSEQHIGRESTDGADQIVLRMIRKIVSDDSLTSSREIKRWLRERL